MKSTPSFVLSALFFTATSFSASAQITVDALMDGSDASPGDGICATASGDCTLRAALQEAEASGVPTTITLPEGTYSWTDGQLLIDEGDITLTGGGTRTTIIDAAGNSRWLEVDGNATLMTIQDLEFRNGFDANDPGGAIETDADLLVLERVVFRDCVTEDAFGGAIHNREDIEVRACSFIGCRAYGNDGANGGGGGGGGLGGGGGICSWSQTETLLENCTFVDCEVYGGDGGNAGGGGSGGNGGTGVGTFGGGGDGGDITSSSWGGNNPDASGAGWGGGGGGGGMLTSWWNPSPGDASSGLAIGGDGGNGNLNAAGGGGGGGAVGGAFFMRSGTATVVHCTMSGNGAFGGIGGNSAGNDGADGEGHGGAIGCFDGDLFLDNNILYGNAGGTAGGDEDLYHYAGDEIAAAVGNNIIGVLHPDVVFAAAVSGNQVGLDPVLLEFGDYGGPTDVFMISACEPLSPAIDGGAAVGVANDQRGEPRVGLPDVGAVEGPAPVELDPLSASVCPLETVELALVWPEAVVTWPDGTQGDNWTTGVISGLALVTTAEGCEEDVSIEVVEIPIETPDLGPDVVVCPGTALMLDAGNPGASHEWSFGAVGQNALVVDSGLVEVTVNVQGCTASDEILVEWFATYPLDLGEDVVLCYGDDVTLDAAVPGWGGLPPVFNWQGGPSDNEFNVSSTGVYSVTATLNGCVTTDEVMVVESPLTTVDLGMDQTICPGDPFILNPGYPNAVCTWQDGSTSPTFSVENTGIYAVNVSLGECQANGQVFIEVVNGFEANLPETSGFCAGDSVLLLAAFGASNYTWQNGVIGNQLWASQPGIYQVTSTIDGCDFTDQVSVVAQPLPQFNLGLDILLCEGESIELDPEVYNADYVLFNDSLTTPTLVVDESGVYTAEVSLGGCVYRDTVEVEVRANPEFSLPQDSILCPGTVLTLETGLAEDVLVTWSTGEVGTSIEVNQPSTYVATSQVSGCQHVDSMTVELSEPILVPLESFYELCLDDSLLLDVEQGEEVYSSIYAWENGNVEARRYIKRGGVYSVEVSNVCDTATHVLEVQQQVCGCQIYVPSAFTPNNDGNNDAWFPVLDCSPYSYKVTVWDRWGRPVFQSLNTEEVWYGQVEGTPGSKTRESGNYFAIDGVYMWEVIIELRKGLVPEIIRENGFVRVLR